MRGRDRKARCCYDLRMRFDLAHLPTDIAVLHRIIAGQAAERETREGELAAAKAGLLAKALEIEKPKLQIARLRRGQLGRAAGEMERAVEQPEVWLCGVGTGVPGLS